VESKFFCPSLIPSPCNSQSHIQQRACRYREPPNHVKVSRIPDCRAYTSTVDGVSYLDAHPVSLYTILYKTSHNYLSISFSLSLSLSLSGLMRVFHHHHCRRLRFIVHDHRRLAIRQRQRGSARARACVRIGIYIPIF